MANGRKPLTGSTNGRAFLLTIASTVIHTVAAGTGTSERVYVYVTNSTGVACTITIYFGAAATAANIILHAYPVSANAVMQLVVPGLILNNGLTVSAVCSADNILTVAGYVEQLNTAS